MNPQVAVDVYLDVDAVLNPVWAGSTVPQWSCVEVSTRFQNPVSRSAGTGVNCTASVGVV